MNTNLRVKAVTSIDLADDIADIVDPLTHKAKLLSHDLPLAFAAGQNYLGQLRNSASAERERIENEFSNGMSGIKNFRKRKIDELRQDWHTKIIIMKAARQNYRERESIVRNEMESVTKRLKTTHDDKLVKLNDSLALANSTHKYRVVVHMAALIAVSHDFCALCQDVIQDDEFVALLPLCGHVYHQACIAEYFNTGTKCLHCYKETSLDWQPTFESNKKIFLMENKVKQLEKELAESRASSRAASPVSSSSGNTSPSEPISPTNLVMEVSQLNLNSSQMQP